MEVKGFGASSKAVVPQISCDRLERQIREIGYEDLAVLDNVLTAALQPKKPSGRYRWHPIPTQR